MGTFSISNSKVGRVLRGEVMTMFEKLCKSASYYERHVAYQDTHFLTVQKQIIKFTDPGLAKTGFREMELNLADLIILCYSAFSLNSLNQLSALKKDLELHRDTPTIIICDEDEYVEEDDEHTTKMSGSGSTSEGYESDPESRSSSIGRHKSMERIVRAHDDNAASIEEGRNFALELGPKCTFVQINSSKFEEGEAFLESLLQSVKSTKRTRRRLTLANIRFPRRLSKSMDRQENQIKRDSLSTGKIELAEESSEEKKLKSKSTSWSNLTALARSSRSNRSTKSSKSTDNQSKACVIM
ncbi:hypothetical protein WR25_07423 [Diploscapter pachys]|uniref:Uncharacterized protein n=1 Tax=Diploscapter pachys TaxID=2018661 RepID=A0A2A2KY43_9BILA|nr:hypothetical protein WR25_07423 [Diploscapter pachys]